MTITADDGRTGTATQAVSVRTHDVRVAAFTAPTAGRVGVTKPISVSVGNQRINENATVILYKGGPGGFVKIARATQYVPRPANDDFADAAPITALPFLDHLPLAAASHETGEPDPSCDGNHGSPSVWYTYTPATTGAYVLDADSFGGHYTTAGSVYTGSTLTGLTEVVCTEGRTVFRADGDFTAKVTISGTGGRTATTTRTVSVRTHDVAITGFTAPAAGRVGVTKPLEVAVANTRYAESVTVTLYKGTSAGYTAVGTLTKAVPARPNRTVKFPFSYTFTTADLAEGNVVFQAVAEPAGVREALPVDNTVIAPATNVRPAAAGAS